MKLLSFLRHAKSGWDDPVARDFDRPLNARGASGAELIGRHAAEQGFAPQMIWASPAVRVVETLDRFQPAAGLEALEPKWDRRIYLASSASLTELLRETPDNIDHALICGHNPGLEDLILELVADDGTSPLRDVVEDKFPTAALATLRCNITRWDELAMRCAHLIALALPRQLDPALGPEED